MHATVARCAAGNGGTEKCETLANISGEPAARDGTGLAATVSAGAPFVQHCNAAASLAGGTQESPQHAATA